jgi:hypothetical protein
MMTLRCTKKLLSRVPRAPVASLQPPTTALGDWYADLLIVKPRWLVLCVNEKSLLSVLIPARPLSSVVSRFRDAVDPRLRALGVSDAARTAELREMDELAIGPTESRSVVGSLIELRFLARLMLEEGNDSDLEAVAARLGRVPCSGAPGHFPDRAAQAFLARSTERGTG